GHHVVSSANAALVENTGIGVGAGADHGVDGIGAPHGRIIALCSLGAGMVEIKRERDHLSLSHQRSGGYDILGPRVVELPDLGVRAPLSPILVFLRRVTKILPRDFTRRHEFLLPSFRAATLR